MTQAIEAEVGSFLAAHAGLADKQGRRRLVRNGHAPERQIQMGIGPLGVRRPKPRDRRGVAASEPIRFTSAVPPAYLRRTRTIKELLPWLYLKDVSTGRFVEALTALLGPEAPCLSPTTVRRLSEGWQDAHRRWQKRALSARRYVYLWADGVYFVPRLDHERQCLLVLIDADASWRKELLAVEDGFCERAQSWRAWQRRCHPASPAGQEWLGGLSGNECAGHDDGTEGTRAWHAAKPGSFRTSCSTDFWPAVIRNPRSAGTACSTS